MSIKNLRCCPKCHSKNIVRVPDNPNRHELDKIQHCFG